jgi:hypothetical protein
MLVEGTNFFFRQIARFLRLIMACFFLFIYYFYTDNELLGAMWRTLLSPF